MVVLILFGHVGREEGTIAAKLIHNELTHLLSILLFFLQLFRDQAIDGEILPVLTEDHLLQNMGMKLGPALKIRLHIAKRLGFTLNGQYCTLKTPYEEVH